MDYSSSGAFTPEDTIRVSKTSFLTSDTRLDKALDAAFPISDIMSDQGLPLIFRARFLKELMDDNKIIPSDAELKAYAMSPAFIMAISDMNVPNRLKNKLQALDNEYFTKFTLKDRRSRYR